MTHRVYFFLLLTIGINVWFLSQLWGKVSVAQINGTAIAKVTEMSGQVMIRPLSQSEWRPLNFNTGLRIGDMVFVGEKSKLVYTYQRERANITIGSNSMFEVTRTPSISSKIFRTFYKTRSIGERKIEKGQSLGLRKNRLYVRMEMSPNVAQNDSNSEPDKQDEEGEAGGGASFKVERVAKPIRILQPVGDLSIVSQFGSVTFPVQLEQPPTVKKIYGYLWKKEGGARPVWSGLVEGHSFSEVNVPAPGEYVFQAMAEDDEFVSPLIHVSLKNQQRENLKSILDKEFDVGKFEGKRVLVLR